MSSKTAPMRIHVAMLNSLRAIDILGGGKLQVTKIKGQFSRTIDFEKIEPKSRFVQGGYIHDLHEMFPIRWSAKGVKDAATIEQILADLEKDGCPDVFVKSLTITKQYSKYNEYYMENQDLTVPFIFHPHPFKPSVFHRLKGSMPSFALYARMKEIRKILSAELDEDTRKRWRDILLINYPHESLSNEDVRNLWRNEACCILLKETLGKFTLMEIAESKEA